MNGFSICTHGFHFSFTSTSTDSKGIPVERFPRPEVGVRRRASVVESHFCEKNYKLQTNSSPRCGLAPLATTKPQKLEGTFLKAASKGCGSWSHGPFHLSFLDVVRGRTKSATACTRHTLCITGCSDRPADHTTVGQEKGDKWGT